MLIAVACPAAQRPWTAFAQREEKEIDVDQGEYF